MGFLVLCLAGPSLLAHLLDARALLSPPARSRTLPEVMLALPLGPFPGSVPYGIGVCRC